MDTNTTPLPRTQDEILARYHARKGDDLLGFEVHEYLAALDFEHARPLLKEDIDVEKVKAEWKYHTTREGLLAQMKDYMTFAFDKAHNHRGISASRSVMHYTAWAWLMGDDALVARLDTTNDNDYAPYGLPLLRAVCEHYGWNPKDHGDQEYTPLEE